jgi:hypothetical protein
MPAMNRDIDSACNEAGTKAPFASQRSLCPDGLQAGLLEYTEDLLSLYSDKK